MATYSWSSLTDGSTIAFDPTADLLDFGSIAAASVEVVALDATTTLFRASGKSVSFTGFGVTEIVSRDLFGSGFRNVVTSTWSRIMVGDNALAGGGDDGPNVLTGHVFGNDLLLGLGGDDSLDGGGGSDVLDGGAGNDTLRGGSSSSDIATASYASAASGVTVSLASLGVAQNTGGAGTDTLFNIDNLWGSAFADQLTGGTGNNLIRGGGGDDLLDGGGGTDTADYSDAAAGVTVNLGLVGAQNTVSAGVDTLSNFENVNGSRYADVLTGSAAANVLDGGAGDDLLSGMGGADRLIGVSGDDTLSGGDGNDTLVAGIGNDELDGGGDVDTADYSAATQAVALDLDAGTAAIGGGPVKSVLAVENAVGTATADLLTGSSGNNALSGGNGDDTLAGLAGDDTLDGGSGTDTASYAAASAGVTVNLSLAGAQPTGGAGSDTLISIERLLGSSFADTLTGNGSSNIIDGGLGDDVLDGGGGYDAVSFISVSGAVSVNLSLSAPQNTLGAGIDTLLNIEGVEGSAFADQLTGNDAANELSGYLGDDSISGMGGADTLRGWDGNDNIQGGSGNDILYGGVGDDLLDGGADFDRVSYSLAAGPVSVDLRVVGPQATGEGSDTLVNVEDIDGGAFADTLIGNGFANMLAGNGGNDTLNGFAGNDTLAGGTGSDQLDGGEGNDILQGGIEADTLQGALGDDYLEGGYCDSYYTGSNYAPLAGTDGDSMAGGAGNDSYQVTATSTQQWFEVSGGYSLTTSIGFSPDLVSENLDEGSDTVEAYVSYTLPANVENLVLMERTFDINGTGNALNNVLTGNSDENVLDGAAGNDTLSGGAGNDTLTGGAGSDTASYADAGSGVSVSLAIAGPQATGGSGSDTLIAIENLTGSAYADTLAGDGGANVLNGAQGDDSLDGGAGNDTLDGGAGSDRLWGGAGADSLIGGDGSDQYYIDHAGDSVTETNANTATGGADQVFSSLAAYTLGANVENGRILAAGIASLTGNGLDNLLYGGIGNSLLDGAGGNDTASYLYGVSSGVSVSLALAGAQATGGSGSDTLVGIENLSGSIHADTLTGDGNANRLEGANGNDTLAGGAGDDTLDGGLGADSLIGGDGSDQYYVDHAGDSVTETNANPVSGGTDQVFSSLAAYTLGAHIENGRILATGAANLVGNALDNRLDAGTGANLLDGAGGNDTVSYLHGASSGVSVSLAIAGPQATGGSGSDTLIAIENLTGSTYDDTLRGDGNANLLNGADGNDFLDGGAGNDTLDGGAGKDRLWGGTGADSLIGGDGSDFYYVDHAGDSVSETNANPDTGGTDQVFTYLATYTLGAHIENGRILATGAANLIGNALDNLLDAGTGNNLLDGAGGNDTVSYLYAVSGSGVSVSLALAGAQATGGSGSDTLIGIENLTGSTYDDTLTGDGNANRLNGAQGNDFLNGGAGNDTLDGGAGNDTLWGGTGADSLVGGDGADFYYIDNAGDSVTESNANPTTGGIDLVYSFLAAYTLGANVENGRILATGAASLTGNALANLLYAGAGNNLLDGAGGNDTASYLYGASSGVSVSLAILGTQATGGSGSDTLTGIEHLIGSTHADTLTGDGLANRLDGGNGNDTLDGGAGNDTLLGGLGNDSLTGGVGADIFRFDTLPNAATNRDTIGDFNVVDDTIELENAIFTSLLNSGPLAAGLFRSGAGITAAGDADDYLIYDTSSGALYYDANGNTGAAPVQIASLAVGLALTSLDFVVT